MWLAVLVVGGVPVLFVLMSALGLAVFHATEGRPVPVFPSLAEHPDRSLQGTVAYVSNDGCVRLVAAAGQPSRKVVCLPAVNPKMEAGPQLVWRPDGRLEVTVFRIPLPATPGPPVHAGFDPGWQKIVDPRTGAVEDVPAAEAPSTPNLTTHPTVNPRGERISYSAGAQTGRIKVVLSDVNGSRTLLSAHGPGEYSYGLTAAFWAPNWQWVAADDGRILVITTGHPAVTRILVDGDAGAPGPSWPRFAVTAANLLTPAP